MRNNLFILLAVFAAVGCGAFAGEPAPAPGALEATTPAQRKIAGRLRNLTAAIAARGTTRGAVLASRPSALSTRRQHVNDAGLVQCYVAYYQTPAAVTALITQAGGQVELTSETRKVVQCWLPYDQMENVAGNALVKAVRLPSYAFHRITVDTQGDTVEQAANVRSQFGFTGTGIKVGVISDGISGIAKAQSTGDMPSTYQAQSTFGNLNAGAEGTAIMEIVYDLAPGAALAFSNCETDLEMSQSINILDTTYHCNIICDDLGFYDEPYFQDGPIVSSINQAYADGAIYVSAAGNDADQNYYEANFTPMTATVGGTSMTVHNFNSPAGQEPYILRVAGPAQQANIILQWGETWGAATSNYVLYQVNSTGTQIYNLSGDASQPGVTNVNSGYPGDPIDWGVVSTSQDYCYFVVALSSGVGDRIKIDCDNQFTDVYTVAGSIWGHPAGLNAVAAGAVYWGTPTQVENFSSQGPVYMLGGTLRQKPDVCGCDGVSITNDGGLIPPPPPYYFYGTSCATPHVAGICALLWSANTSRTNSEIKNMVLNSAVNISGTPGWNGASGYGLANALDAVNSDTAPVANSQNLQAIQGTALPIVLTASVSDGGALTYKITVNPGHGSLSGIPPNVTYTSASSFYGSDSFAFVASDGILSSNAATVSITVAPNGTPLAVAQTVTVQENGSLGVTLNGTGKAGDTLVYTVTANPSHGGLTGTPPNVTYTPNTGYFGSDSFSFVLTDQTNGLQSAPAVITVSVNAPPVALAQNTVTYANTLLNLTLVASDPDGGTFFSYTVVSQPAKGSLSGSGPSLTYAPDLNYIGSDSFTFKAADLNGGISNIATVTISVKAAPPPVASSLAPASGTPSGGTVVTVSGVAFATVGTVAVTFGGTPATSVVVKNPTTLTCVTPAGTLGTVNVVVTNPDAQASVPPAAYTYVLGPQPAALTPVSGPDYGGTSITITGSGFASTGFPTSGVVTVTVGGTLAASVTVSSSGSLTCTTPAHADGAVDVVVTNPDGQSGTLPGAFTYVPVPPSINSPLTASATLAAPFSYTVTASGSLPMSFTAAPLPPGLTLNGSLISGTPAQAGQIAITLQAANAAGTSTPQVLTLAIIDPDVPAVQPQFLSAPTAQPNPAHPGALISFEAAAGDANGDLLDYMWSFGDGSTADGVIVTHSYAASSLYEATVTVSNGRQADPYTIPVAIDTAGSLPSAGGLTITHVALAFNLATTGKDTLTFSGKIAWPEQSKRGFNAVTIGVGAYSVSMTLNKAGTRGTNTNKNAVFTLSGKGNALKYTFTVSKVDLRTPLLALGFNDVTTKGTLLDLPIVISIDGVGEPYTAALLYVATENKTGRGKL